jgi:DNA polymerase III subunit beta
MKLSCFQEKLNHGLNVVGRAAAARTTLPITSNVLMETDHSRLKLSATNLEMAISCWIGAKVEEEGAITVNARLLTEFINSLPNDKVDVSLPARSKSLKLKCARFEARISGIDAKDFPPVPTLEGGISTSVEAEAFRQAISKVAFSTAVDESRPVLTGVNAQFDGDSLTLAAADGFRLAVYKMSLAKPVKVRITAIVPARTLSELNRLTGAQDETIAITIDTQKSQILFKLKDIEIVSQLIQGTFPQYSQLIPQSFSSRAVVDTSAFQMATKAAAIFARDGGGIVRLIMTPGSDKLPGKLSISARSEEIGEDEGEIDAAVEGEEAKIAFNGKYLTDVLGVISESQVALEVTNPSSPGVIRPVGVDNYTHVIMPMFVQW